MSSTVYTVISGKELWRTFWSFESWRKLFPALSRSNTHVINRSSIHVKLPGDITQRAQKGSATVPSRFPTYMFLLLSFRWLGQNILSPFAKNRLHWTLNYQFMHSVSLPRFVIFDISTLHPSPIWCSHKICWWISPLFVFHFPFSHKARYLV